METNGKQDDFEEIFYLALKDKIGADYDKSEREAKDKKEVEHALSLFKEKLKKQLEQEKLKDLLSRHKNKHAFGMPRTPKSKVIEWLVEDSCKSFRITHSAKKYHQFHAEKTKEYFSLNADHQVKLLEPFLEEVMRRRN